LTLLPRLVIPQGLPSKSDPATLFLIGANHTIALDGTSGDMFNAFYLKDVTPTKSVTASFAKLYYGTWHKFKTVLDNLKDM
jgi:hypothetical protein